MSLPSININANDPNATLASIGERDQQRYQQDYVPVEDKLISSLKDTSIVSDARESSNRNFGQAAGRFNRNQARYGTSAGAIDRQENKQGFALGKAKSTASTMNEARVDQFGRNLNLRNEIINIGRGVSSDASRGFGEAASLQTSRQNFNRSQDAQAKSNMWGTIGSVGSTALMAAMVL